MSRILAISGKKQSGKNTLSNFLHGHQLTSMKIIDGFELTEKGDLVIDTLVINSQGKEERGKGIVDITRSDFDFASWAAYNVWPYIRNYAFANPLKDIIEGLFEMPRENLYGTDSQKNMTCQYKWEDMPTNPNNKSGYMTYREFMQYFGNLCRKIYSEVWINRTIKDILQEEPSIAIISDLRYPNELEAVKSAGGKVIRLLRQVDTDSDDSEIAMDDCNNFDAVIDNRNMTIHESCKALLETLDEWGWLSKEISKAKSTRQFTTSIK